MYHAHPLSWEEKERIDRQIEIDTAYIPLAYHRDEIARIELVRSYWWPVSWLWWLVQGRKEHQYHVREIEFIQSRLRELQSVSS